MDKDREAPESPPPFRVLSLDGGGVRGVYTAAFLNRLVDAFARQRECQPLDLGKGFDLITGTSTGAIVGCALAKGVPLPDIVSLYRKHAKEIFPHHITGKGSALWRAVNFGRYVRNGDRALRAALAEKLGTTTLVDVFRDRGIALSIPAVTMSQHRAYVFKKTARSGNRNDNHTLADACLASSAAPIFRSLAAVNDPNSGDGVPDIFADGGLWANNPVLVGLVDALLSAPKGRPIEIFSLGTCSRPEGEMIPRSKVHRGMFSWWLGAKVAPLSISAQEFAFDHMARMLANQFTDCGRPVTVVRFPKTSIPANLHKYLDLDDSSDDAIDALITQARNDADMTKSACDDPNNPEGKLITSLLQSLPILPRAGEHNAKL